MNNQNAIFNTILVVVGCFAVFAPKAFGVVPPPDGGYPGGNTAEGQNALFSLTSGGFNTAVGYLSLRSDTTGPFNTAIGAGALLANATAEGNTATGAGALLSNTAGFGNTANGAFALLSNTSGNLNTAMGDGALSSNTTGGTNTAIGQVALGSNTTGNANVALGQSAGSSLTSGDGNVCIGNGVSGVAGESNHTRIRNIGSTPIVGGFTVVIEGTGGTGDQTLGVLGSSRRYKEAIKPMDNTSETLLALKPVIFRAKGDPKRITHYGLIAEDVAKVNPDLVGYNADDQPETVRYDAVNAMLLNEFLKEHKTVQELKKEIAVIRATVRKQDSKIRKVSDQLELNNPSPQLVDSHK